MQHNSRSLISRWGTPTHSAPPRTRTETDERLNRWKSNAKGHVGLFCFRIQGLLFFGTLVFSPRWFSVCSSYSRCWMCWIPTGNWRTRGPIVRVSGKEQRNQPNS